MQWVFQVGDLGQFETTPLVVDGVLYGTGQNDRAFAIDARTGRPIWRYQRNLPEKLQPCCGMVNRGMAILGTGCSWQRSTRTSSPWTRRSGNLLWDVTAADYPKAYTFTVAPLVVKNEVIVGISGGEYGVRGFIDAYDAATGRRFWRFDTVPAPGDPGHETWRGDSWKTGGVPAWITGTYDPRTESGVLADRKPGTEQLRRRAQGGQSLQQLHAGARRRYRKIKVVFPIHSA